MSIKKREKDIIALTLTLIRGGIQLLPALFTLSGNFPERTVGPDQLRNWLLTSLGHDFSERSVCFHFIHGHGNFGR